MGKGGKQQDRDEMTEGHSPFATIFYNRTENLRILNGHPSHYKAVFVNLGGKSIL